MKSIFYRVGTIYIAIPIGALTMASLLTEMLGVIKTTLSSKR